MSARTAGNVALVTTGLIVTGCLGYAVYFDYQRRHSPAFRKSLKKQHDKLAAAAKQRIAAEREKNAHALVKALQEIESETMPSQPEMQEAYFQEQVAQGERLAVMGPEYHVEAASRFHRALRVYPQPMELLEIYKKVVPPAVFTLIIEITMLSDKTGGGAVPAAPAPPTLEDMLASMMAPPPQASSIEDLDDSSPLSETSPKADSATSGASWEKVDEA